MRRVVPIALLAALASGCGGSEPAPLTISGTIAIAPRAGGWTGGAGERCETGTSGGHSDLKEGAQIVISDATAKTLAIGHLGGGAQDGVGGCKFSFRVTEVPVGHDFYGVEVTHRGRLQYTAEQVTKPIEMTL